MDNLPLRLAAKPRDEDAWREFYELFAAMQERYRGAAIGGYSRARRRADRKLMRILDAAVGERRSRPR